jgi:hypothetical protein
MAKQFIEPIGSIKFPGIVNPESIFPHLVILANALHGRFEIENDMHNDYYVEGYEDKTQFYFEMLKRYFPDFDFDVGKWREEMGED